MGTSQNSQTLGLVAKFQYGLGWSFYADQARTEPRRHGACTTDEGVVKRLCITWTHLI